MNETQTPFAQVGELLATLAVKSDNLVEANKYLTLAQLAKHDADITLTQKTADAINSGEVTGSNESARKASLALLTIDETHSVEIAERNLLIAKSNVTIAEIEYRTINTVINTTTAFSTKI